MAKKKVTKSRKVSKNAQAKKSRKSSQKKVAPKKQYRSIVRVPSAVLEEARVTMARLPDNVVEAVKSGISAVDKKHWPDSTTIVVNDETFIFNTFALANLLGIR